MVEQGAQQGFVGQLGIFLGTGRKD